MSTVESCCCGCSLRTGTLILLWVNAVSAAINIVGILDNEKNLSFLMILIHVLCRIIFINICALGIYGIKKNRRDLLKPFLAYQLFHMVLVIIIMIGLAFFGVEILYDLWGMSNNNGNEVSVTAIVIVMFEIILLLFLGLQYYFFSVVLSFYKQLEGIIPV